MKGMNMKDFLVGLRIVVFLMAIILLMIFVLTDEKSITRKWCGSKIDRWEFVIDAIGQVESGNRDLNRHADGQSYGRYGITQIAVNELIRSGIIAGCKYDLTDPNVNREMAEKYLSLMYVRAVNRGAERPIDQAIMDYHSRKTSKGKAYWVKVKQAMRGLK